MVVNRPQFTTAQRAFLVKYYNFGYSWEKMKTKYQQAFPGARVPARSTMYKIVNKFRKEHTTHNLNKGRSGPPKTVTTVANIERVRRLLEYEKTLPLGYVRSSCRRNDLGIKKSTLNAIIRVELKYRPYVLSRVFKLSENAKAKRIEMCTFLVRQPRLYFDRLVITDEAIFQLDGHVYNRNNCICYSRHGQGRPDNFHSQSTQAPAKLMVFLCVTGDGSVFGPYFYEESITAERYRAKLRLEVFPDMMGHYGQQFTHLIFQQDGASVHRSRTNIAFLDNLFGARLLALGAPRGHDWAPTSPDLSALDFSIWNQLKVAVFRHPLPQNLQELRQKITLCAQGLGADFVSKAVHHTKARAAKCLQANGGYFEGRRM